MKFYDKKSLNTKKKMAKSLKKMMKKKEFHKISINDIVNDCKINRNSFYYHFENIYELLKWTFEQEAMNALKNITLSNDIEHAINFMMEYIDENKIICKCAYESIGRDELRKFFIKDFQEIIITIVEDEIKNNKYYISDEFKNYIIYTYAELIASHLISYLNEEFKFNKDKIPKYMLTTIKESLNTSLKIASDNNL